MSGPKLTQRKIDKLRDAINIVAETVQWTPATETFASVRALCDFLERQLEKKVSPRGME